jgi:hypothetical protein
LKCAPDTGPKARISATSPPALEQLEADVVRGELGGRDTRADDYRNEKRGAAVLGEGSTSERRGHQRSRAYSGLPAAGLM